MNKVIHRGYLLVNPCPEPETMLTVAVPPALRDELADYSRLTGITPAQAARRGLALLIEMETEQRAALARMPLNERTGRKRRMPA